MLCKLQIEARKIFSTSSMMETLLYSTEYRHLSYVQGNMYGRPPPVTKKDLKQLTGPLTGTNHTPIGFQTIYKSIMSYKHITPSKSAHCLAQYTSTTHTHTWPSPRHRKKKFKKEKKKITINLVIYTTAFASLWIGL